MDARNSTWSLPHKGPSYLSSRKLTSRKEPKEASRVRKVAKSQAKVAAIAAAKVA
jgi:hypothetical protein